MNDVKIINGYPFIKYKQEEISPEQSLIIPANFLDSMLKRRSIRYFSDKPVSKEIITIFWQLPILPHQVPINNHGLFAPCRIRLLKKQIRDAAEKEEYESYHGRMPAEWLNDLAPLQTDWKKSFLETAPWLIVVFQKIIRNR